MKISPKSTNFVYFGVFFWIAIQAILLTGQLITSLTTTGIFSTDKVSVCHLIKLFANLSGNGTEKEGHWNNTANINTKNNTTNNLKVLGWKL